ncbi:MAG: hypothetical protein ACFE0R_18170 [Salinarimonas sp.]
MIAFMTGALEDAGCRIIYASPPTRAPFVISFETARGERQGIVAYAFRATRTPTRNRPSDERSFQLKYGSKADFAADNVHELWQDPTGLFTTLLVGIDPVDGFFVAADPVLRSPTKLFIRLEFKDEHAEAIKTGGWHAWERKIRPKEPDDVGVFEVLVGGRRERFLDLVRFERAAKGLDAGNRQLLAEKPSLYVPLLDPAAPRPSVDDLRDHPLLAELGLPPEGLLEVIQGASRLKMAVRGWVAERHLREQIAQMPGVVDCRPIDGDGQADLLVHYREAVPFRIECKNVLRQLSAAGLPRLDFQRTRAAKGDPCSRYYAPSDFEVVAACLHAVTEEWEFRFAATVHLPGHRKCAGKLNSSLVIGPDWGDDPFSVLGLSDGLSDVR